MMRWLILLLLPCVAAAGPDTLRVATFNTELQRDGPGLMLRDIRRDKDPQIAAVVEVIRQTAPDVLALQGIDWDYENQGLNALVERIENTGLIYPYRLSLRPNSGLASKLDLDGDGRLGGPGDSQGYGSFTGQGGWRCCHAIRSIRTRCAICPRFYGRRCRAQFYRPIVGLPFHQPRHRPHKGYRRPRIGLFRSTCHLARCS